MAKEKMGREAQRARWEKNRREAALRGLNVRAKKGSQKEDSKGAFGKPKHPYASGPALSPKAMREKYPKKKKGGKK